MALNYKRLKVPDLIVIEPKIWPDERVFFLEKYKESDFKAIGIPSFIQDNYSVSRRGVIRGLHYQISPHEQGKLVTVVGGSVWDVAVDVRRSSKTFGEWVGVELSEGNNLMFYVPPGFAHGFSVLSEEARFLYKCTNEYSSESERGIRFDDADLAIDWKVTEDGIVSDRDRTLPTFKDVELFM